MNIKESNALRTQFLIMHWWCGIDLAYYVIKRDAKNAKS